MLIDTHTHYNFEGIKHNWLAHWELAQAKGVTHAIQIGTNMETSAEVVKMVQSETDFFAAVGVHPQDIEDLQIEQLRKLAQLPKVVAIGEIGLDYFRLDLAEPASAKIAEQQKIGLIEQLKIANELNLPVILHVRDQGETAYQDLIEIISKYQPVNHFVLHCVSGPDFYIKAMIEKNAWFGFDGNITYKNADRIREILAQVPQDKIVVETDAPFLPPVPHRGKVCEPWMLTITANYLTENFNLTKDILAENTKQLFSKAQFV